MGGSIVNFRPCVWENEAALCFFRGQKRRAIGFGHGVVLNRHYEQVSVFGAVDGPVDMHECRTTASGSALFTVYRARPHDFGFKNGVGWLLDSGFQEIDVRSANASLLFSWNALDHVHMTDSTLSIAERPEIFGSGRSHLDAFDFFHVNSVDKDADGNYLISARHADSLYMISRTDGRILWQLGGKQSSFRGTGTEFRRQHDARYVFGNKTHSLITLFDNAADCYTVFGNESQGLEILLDHVTLTATTQRRFRNGLVSCGMGSLQTRANGDALLCSGSTQRPVITKVRSR
ncbi:uncharacterized protein MYCFIDRAFT_143069 [Pseudocercospora fijiensis CIRAD86]|uniref:Uncharacterized protein n=1 Tax=Pseudocercospora fijiensis (strain CIRAD86) TaxID=383855 RepID=M3APJ6_PSEFD|nr:uncharacterized protein MYCFIDRAFT_143069 [Pseudocercospora fijiensis CIRAD86]EME79048.1 hypothetical protein MYCFIDRAFT_143069 [Pseudocercospora fijiensis CIRAD86]